MNVVKGYKVFNPDWTCRGKQYSCPGKFEEDVSPVICNKGMHFCKKVTDCFYYYDFDPKYHIAKVIAYGKIAEQGNKCCTNKLEIVREIPWLELLEIANTGQNCTGFGNSGNQNSGNHNGGNLNSGTSNYGNRNSGYRNSGNSNSGDYNSGSNNTGHGNSGSGNSGYNNSGYRNSGNFNSGDYNSGNCNIGWGNSGDWNVCNYSSGCFNTIEPKIYLFNKPSEWTHTDWRNSQARRVLRSMPVDAPHIVEFEYMTDEEIAKHPEARIMGCYLSDDKNPDRVTNWWRKLPKKDKEAVMAIPNFDKEIFKQITGIDVEE